MNDFQLLVKIRIFNVDLIIFAPQKKNKAQPFICLYIYFSLIFEKIFNDDEHFHLCILYLMIFKISWEQLLQLKQSS